jgi:hypothetical protein
MDRKNHDGLESEMEEGHNPLTAVADSVASVKAASQIGKKQSLRKGDKSNAESISKLLMTKESIDLKDFTLEEIEDFMMSEDFEKLDELSKATLKSYKQKAQDDDGTDYDDDSNDHRNMDSVRDRKILHRDIGIDRADARLSGKGPAKMKKPGVKKESFDFEEDLDALVESEATLSESFRAKAEVIFEAALSSKLSEHVERLEEDYQTQLDEQVQQIQESLVEKIDGYLNYVVESWVEENKLAIGNGLRTEIAESFMSALHGVFTEHYIQVPDEKVDLVDGLAEKIEELEEQLNKSVQYNIGLTEAVNEFARESVIRESAKDLSAAQGERLRSLVEDIAFDSEDAFAQKVETVKNSYFRKVSVQTQAEEELLDENTKEVQVSPMMQQYLNALKK